MNRNITIILRLLSCVFVLPPLLLMVMGGPQALIDFVTAQDLK